MSEARAGIRRDAPSLQKKCAATLAGLRGMLAPIQDDVRGLRATAQLLVGFAGALRRSELADIRFADLERIEQGFRLTQKRSKRPQVDAVTFSVPYRRTELCPVPALTTWLATAGITAGPVFRRIRAPPATADGPPALLAIAADPPHPPRLPVSFSRAPPVPDSSRASLAVTARSAAH